MSDEYNDDKNVSCELKGFSKPSSSGKTPIRISRILNPKKEKKVKNERLYELAEKVFSTSRRISENDLMKVLDIDYKTLHENLYTWLRNFEFVRDGEYFIKK